MKQIHKDILLALLMGMVLPGMILQLMTMPDRGRPVADLNVSAQPSQPAGEQTHAPVAITMYLRQRDGSVTAMDMDTYLVGVVLAEMPASFEEEAKKAQAIVARTFTLKAVSTGGKHGDGSVCTDSACCQAYITPESYLDQGGTREGVSAAEAAVTATSGYVLTYQGQLIEATYFSCSGGSTEDAIAVWGTDYPYLRATDSPGEEHAAHYTDTVEFTAEEFETLLDRDLRGTPESWFGLTTYTAGGGIASMDIGGTTYTGTQLRKLLGLRSTAFTVTAENDSIRITTRGFGHRVGMSQYGADAMAASGSSYDEILQHYYQGTALTCWEGEN